MEICLLWAAWAHEDMASFFIYGHRTLGHFKRAGSMWFRKIR